ncbi:MAG: glutamate synthase-related protein [Candidatus Marinimicrobia bacterium]|nr:glutamate synthase-related protein [Candidatus Neomarinimicrobiota bacterium]
MDKKIKIFTSDNGPLIAENPSSLTQSTNDEVAVTGPTVALCRCGHSESKPFCDGTHGKIGWKDNKQEGRQPRRIDSYKGKTVTIHDDRGICSHAGFCTDGLPHVFRMGVEPWIDPDAESADKIIETIEKCPSGALSYSIDGVLHDKYSDRPKIQPTENGPYYVKGGIKLIDDDHPNTEDHYALCRCGNSKNKPFCDGSHWYTKFKDEGLVKPRDWDKNERIAGIQKRARYGISENSAMSTLRKFPGFETLMFKGGQFHKMPLNEETPVNTRTVIGRTAKKPIVLDMPFYVSHMSFGALSREAKIALAKGSTLVGTAMCSGEGGMLPESRKAAAVYIYELGTAAFSHNDDAIRQADAVELKIGQAVKPGVGGHLPGAKVTEEIARIRGLRPGRSNRFPRQDRRCEQP